MVSINVLAIRYYQNTEFGLDALSQPRFNRIFREPISDQIRREQIIEAISEVRSDDLDQIRNGSLVIFAVLVGLSIVGGNIIAGEVLSPIRDLNKQVKKIQAESMDRINYPHNDADLQELVDSLNAMLSRLGRSFQSQREFVEHASHELKTPLASLMIQLESLLEQGSITDDERSSMDRAIAKITTMNGLIEDLTLLSLEKEQLVCSNGTFSEIIDGAVSSTQELAQSRQISVNVRNVPAAMVCVSTNLLERAVANMLENAIKYSSENTEIIVEGQETKQQVGVRIIDQGPGIPEDQIHRVFDRFYRVDGSRSRKTGGRGLGLAITKTIIELHHGTITVHNNEHGGAAFTLMVPKA